jgi:hypothetical protein
VRIELDADKVVSGVIAALIIQLGKDAIPHIKRALITCMHGFVKVVSRPVAWFNERNELLGFPLTLRPRTEYAFLKKLWLLYVF